MLRRPIRNLSTTRSQRAAFAFTLFIMLTSSKFSRILQRADAQLVREFQQVAFFAKIPSGHDVFLEGNLVDSMLNKKDNCRQSAKAYDGK